jgi:hypothetical protein
VVAHHVIAVHDHEDVLQGDLLGLAHCRVDLLQQHVVEIGTLAVQLPGFLYSVTDIEHIRVACMAPLLTTLFTVNTTKELECSVNSVKTELSTSNLLGV